MILITLLFVFAALPASAQRLKLDFPGLAERAEEVVDITLDADMLKLAAKFFSGKDDQDLRDTVRGLQGIYVRSYEFAREGEYDRRLIDQVRSQLGSSWKPLVTVRSKSKENVNIYADMRGENIVGLVVIASEPREFTVVNIVGPIDMDKLSRLQGQFGIPDVADKKEGSRE
jgi:hypothetical protein